MAESIGSTRGIHTIVLKGYNPNYIVEKRVNGSDIKPGKIVTNYGESNKHDVDLCGAGEPPLGIALEHYFDDGLAGTNRDPLDIDTVYADNSVVRVGLIGSGMTVVGYMAGQTTTTTIYAGSNIVAAASGNVQLPTYSSTTAELHNDFEGRIGKSAEYNTGGSSVKTLAMVI